MSLLGKHGEQTTNTRINSCGHESEGRSATRERRNHGLETTSEPTNNPQIYNILQLEEEPNVCNNLISFRGKRIYKRSLMHMRPELCPGHAPDGRIQQEYKKHQNQGGDRNHDFFGRGNRNTREAGSPQDSSGGCGSGRDDRLFSCTR